jgi:predicted dehydrogenase
MKKTGIAIVGCGNISGIYFKNLCTLFNNVEVIACADLDAERIAAKLEEFPSVKAATLEEILANPAVELIVNLTTPQGHFPVAMQAVQAGKHVYNEKPVVLTREEGKQLLEAAEANNVLVGSAPDTFMGGGIQTCRKLIDEGWIGDPIGAQAFMLCRGHESWHPDPEFYYKVGGGPMFDMGPYYVTALVSLLGPVTRVSGSTGMSFAERTITSEKKFGEKVQVEVPTHVTGILDFACGAIGTIVTSFDVVASETPRIEIFGTEGTISVPDPNGFGGVPKIRRFGASEWSNVPLTHGYADNSRGLGVADMASAAASGRKARASGELACHVLDIMHAIHDASDAGQHLMLETTCTRPAAMPMNLLAGSID